MTRFEKLACLLNKAGDKRDNRLALLVVHGEAVYRWGGHWHTPEQYRGAVDDWYVSLVARLARRYGNLPKKEKGWNSDKVQDAEYTRAVHSMM